MKEQRVNVLTVGDLKGILDEYDEKTPVQIDMPFLTNLFRITHVRELDGDLLLQSREEIDSDDIASMARYFAGQEKARKERRRRA